MFKNKLVEFLCQINIKENPGTDENLYEKHFVEICTALSTDQESIVKDLQNITSLNFVDEISPEWKCIILSFYLMKILNLELEKSDEVLLSVQQMRDIKKCLGNIVEIGICYRLQPNLPFSIKSEKSEENIFWNYNLLKCTTFGLCEFLKSPHMRLLVLPDYLKEILVAVFQISFCPLKKPVKDSENSNNVMTEEVYEKLLKDKELFVKLLDHLRNTIHPDIFVKELMIIFRETSPIWFKKSVSRTLSSIIRSKNGVENIAKALIGDCDNDSTQTWRILDVFSRLILSCKTFPDFEDNICKQVIDLLDKVPDDSSVYDRVFVHCTKAFYQVDCESAKNTLVRAVITYFIYFTYKGHTFQDGDVTRKIKQNSRLLHSIFVQNSVESPSLPLKMLKPVMNVLFRFYTLTSNCSLNPTKNDLRAILLGYLRRYPEDLFELFDCFLFGINSVEVLPFRKDISIMTEEDKLVLKLSKHSVDYPSSENASYLLELIKSDSDVMQKLFGFLLNCLTNKDKYFKKENVELLVLENEMMNEFFERKIMVYRVLSNLAEDKAIQEKLTEDPQDIIKYIEEVLQKTLELGTHKSTNTDSEDFQSLFTVLMILHSLVANCEKTTTNHFKPLLIPLTSISVETVNDESRDLINRIREALGRNNDRTGKHLREEKTELDKAIDDICDPLLPTRGHGLMTLTKLVERKEKNAMDRKNYILGIFQQNLKNKDSFIYLSAISGLAALADVFPDSILNILCEEYSDSSKNNSEDGHEVRMKLGECLVRVTKTLGDMAPKYKPLLLNTFLVGAKEDDDLIRASSLSNLGEICRVLGYKLGTIVTEVLTCVHAIITTDKSPQARRAAVTVLRQLFIGLDKGMISFLKDDILPIYRTLKDIYDRDDDEVMRLQSQLALEELNENMKNFVLASPELHSEKKIIMLN
ncbi:hypothetical protein JTB14_037476 [Gonioctena quinquepunctata]|nr:hypothetical protein JTB14_037476 [Gonioctena quinquepunctata]